MTSSVHRFSNVRREEVAPLIAAAFYFFFVLTALMMLAPARDAIGMERGLDAIRWLFIGTARRDARGQSGIRLAGESLPAPDVHHRDLRLLRVQPGRLLRPDRAGAGGRRRRERPCLLRVVQCVQPVQHHGVLGTDGRPVHARAEQARCSVSSLVGGTLGAIFGPWLANQLAVPLGTPALLLVGAAFLGLAAGAAWLVARLQPEVRERQCAARLTGRSSAVNAWAGISAVFRSPYLPGHLLLRAVDDHLLHLHLLHAPADGRRPRPRRATSRPSCLRRSTWIAQMATLVLQALVVRPPGETRRCGCGADDFARRGVAGVRWPGDGRVASSPSSRFDAAFRATQRAIARPARETLFTVVNREEKYKSKAFTDTFVYRGGDVVGAWTEGLLGRLGFALVGLASVAVRSASRGRCWASGWGRISRSWPRPPSTRPQRRPRADADLEPHREGIAHRTAEVR